MAWVLALAAKSLLLAGGTLLLLKLMHNRSASDRSWIAHLGLAALLLLPVASFAMPALDVPGPAFLTGDVAEPVAVPVKAHPAPEVAPVAASFPHPSAPTQSWSSSIDWTYAGYALPAALLLLLTLIAIGRLVALKARAQVLVDGHWLSALARAQRRMGFKSGTALLTSSDLRSPVSWGLMRPVIVLNDDATEARDDAEAIIAHELAHVARLDWAKLLLARVAVALFWFNPFVWLLAREAHQLREEAADDAVLGSDIDDTDYARLLVGVARHECNGLLLGAHGVAPSRNSLSRRVRRVLDRALTRAPGGWRWTSAAAFFAAGMAVPVAALNFVPTTPVSPAVAEPASVGGKARALAAPAAVAAAGAGVAAVGMAHPHSAADLDADSDLDHDTDNDVDVDIDDEINDAMAEVRAGSAEVRASVASLRASPRIRPSQDRALDQAVTARMMGITPDYARRIRGSSPSLRSATMNDLIGMKMHGVTPELVQELGRIGYRDITPKQVTGAAMQGVNARYAREMAVAGYGNLTLRELTSLRMYGIDGNYVRQFQRAGYRKLTASQLIKMHNAGVAPNDLDKGDFDGP
jgi:beta-lactamase regulating signal transducer with metallopeptidase domain